jgi:hypothetical protein
MGFLLVVKVAAQPALVCPDKLSSANRSPEAVRSRLEGVGSGQPTSFEGGDKETQTADQQTAASTPNDAICCPTCGKVVQPRQIIQPKKRQPP